MRSVSIATAGSSLASDIFVGDFTRLAIAIRSPFRVEVSREAYGAWEVLAVKFRAWLRADVAVLNPGAFAIVVGVTPT